MSVQVAPPSVARGVGAKHTQRYEALKRELEEFCAKGPQVRILECAAARRRTPPRRRRAATSRARALEFARARLDTRVSAPRDRFPLPRARTFPSDFGGGCFDAFPPPAGRTTRSRS